MSWVVVEKATLDGVFKASNEITAKQINTEKYQAVPIMLYLGSLNLHTEQEKRDYMQIKEHQNDLIRNRSFWHQQSF